jgi:hypothetical protein
VAGEYFLDLLTDDAVLVELTTVKALDEARGPEIVAIGPTRSHGIEMTVQCTAGEVGAKARL